MKLLDGVTVDTVGDVYTVEGVLSGRKDHERSFFVYSSDFGGGTVRIEVSPDNTNWFTARTSGSDAQMIFTQSDYILGYIRAPYIRAVLADAVSPGALTVIML